MKKELHDLAITIFQCCAENQISLDIQWIPRSDLERADYTSGRRVAPRLVRSSPDRAVRVRALAGDNVLCSWVRHFALTVPLSTQVFNAGGIPAMEWHPIQGGVEILLVASCHRNRS